MHPAAFEWVSRWAPQAGNPCEVLEVGALDVNGSIRHLFPHADPYVGIDLVAGPGVDVVCDAGQYEAPRTFSVVVSAECLEHARDWRAVLDSAYRALGRTGLMILTFATTGRPPHRAHGLEWPPSERDQLGDPEHYRNVSLSEFAGWADGRFRSMELAVTAEHDLHFAGRR